MKNIHLALAIVLVAAPWMTAVDASADHQMGEKGRLGSDILNSFSETSGTQPSPSASTRAYQDVRIGSPRIGAQTVDLDFHRGTGNIFAAVSWGTGWSMNISTDGGASWQETYFYPFESEISMKVGGDFVWVAYSSSSVAEELRMRRFLVETGASDNAYFFHTIADISPATVVDVAMTSNADAGDSGVYVACIGSDNAVYFFWDDLVGIDFDPFHPPITNAQAGLDITLNPGAGSGFFLFISFQGAGALQVWRLHIFGGWDHSIATAATGSNTYTAISAYDDTVVTMIESDFTNGNGILQFVNTNAGLGGDWFADVIYSPASTGSPEAAGPDVSLRSSSGSVLTYQLEEGTFDGVYYRRRLGHGLGSWSNAVSFNEVDSAAQEQTTVEWLGTTCISSFGTVYTSGGDFIPYFDLVSPRAFFCDGFESGDTSGWD